MVTRHDNTSKGAVCREAAARLTIYRCTIKWSRSYSWMNHCCCSDTESDTTPRWKQKATDWIPHYNTNHIQNKVHKLKIKNKLKELVYYATCMYSKEKKNVILYKARNLWHWPTIWVHFITGKRMQAVMLTSSSPQSGKTPNKSEYKSSDRYGL